MVPHLRLRPAAVVVLALVTLSLALPRGTFAGAIEDQLHESLGRLDTSDLKTGVLYDRVLPLSGIERFAGDGHAVASRALWRQLYEELRRASADPTQRPSVEALIERARRRQDAVPLAVVFDGYERIRKDALERGAIENSDGHLVRGSGEAFEAHTAFAAAALREWTYRGSDVRFVLSRRDYFSNREGVTPRLEADLDDGLGFRSMSFDQPITAHYAATGTKTLRLRATTGATTVEAALAFSVRALAAPAPDDTLHVTGTIPYLGGVASGDAYVALAPGHTQLVNPAVVVEGFDLDNSMNWDELYALLNQENLIEQLKNGARALHAPLNMLEANWAYMVIASLAWSLKAWFALLTPGNPLLEHAGRDQRQHAAGNLEKRHPAKGTQPGQWPQGSSSRSSRVSQSSD
jgi:hypothetical protein